MQLALQLPQCFTFRGPLGSGCKIHEKLLIRVVGAHILTYEELTTVVRQIKSVLNSRPFTPLSSDLRLLGGLTPDHFLIGQPLLSVSEPNVLDAPSHLTSREKLVHQCYQAFWKMWSSEYLNSLQLLSKWTSTDTQLRVGDLVLIKDSSTPLCWLLGISAILINRSPPPPKKKIYLSKI